eukprot:gb/GECG01011559.1/.p1 GENE.gb/GECG01011559.1/~~gb/GECG01011559.1/.p1  ORF type:complete len:124 (+),score=10.19 gb/GECG01011559.1/:1-372(+)
MKHKRGNDSRSAWNCDNVVYESVLCLNDDLSALPNDEKHYSTNIVGARQCSSLYMSQSASLSMSNSTDVIRLANFTNMLQTPVVSSGNSIPVDYIALVGRTENLKLKQCLQLKGHHTDYCDGR